MIYQMDIEQPARIELLRQIGVIRFHSIIDRHVVEYAIRRQSNSDLIFANRLDGRIYHFKYKAGTVLYRTTITIGTLIGVWTEELLQQVAIGAMQLDTIEACRNSIARTLGKLFNG